MTIECCKNIYSYLWVQQTDQILVICKWLNQLSSDATCAGHDLQNEEQAALKWREGSAGLICAAHFT